MDNQQYQIVPVVIKGVDLQIDFRLDQNQAREKLERATEILKTLRHVFGEHCLLDELTQVIFGTIEKVTIAGYSDAKYAREKQAKEELRVENEHLGMYMIQTRDIPISGYQLKLLDPMNIGEILNNPQKKSMLHPQDVSMMQNYYNTWLKSQVNSEVDYIPF